MENSSGKRPFLKNGLTFDLEILTKIVHGIPMKTTMDLPEELLDTAMKLSKSESTDDLVKRALEYFARKCAYEELKALQGKVDIEEVDFNVLRQRIA